MLMSLAVTLSAGVASPASSSPVGVVTIAPSFEAPSTPRVVRPACARKLRRLAVPSCSSSEGTVVLDTVQYSFLRPLGSHPFIHDVVTRWMRQTPRPSHPSLLGAKSDSQASLPSKSITQQPRCQMSCGSAVYF